MAATALREIPALDPAPAHRPTPDTAAAVLAPAVALVAVFAIVAGLGEVAYSLFVALVQHQISHRTPQAVWMAPALNAALFAVPALALALLGRLGARWWLAALVGTLATLTGFALLRLVPGLADWARLALALGIGVRLGAFGRRQEAALRRRLPAVAGAFVAVTAALAGGYNVVRVLGERHALATLPAAAPAAPNVLLVVWDAVRAQSLSAYGAERPTTPRLAQLAARGVLFDRAISTSPWTLPAHAGLFTGEYADRLSTGWITPLDGRQPTLAEVLARHGYATAGFVSNVFYTAAGTGLARGMAHYEDYGFRPGDFFLSAALGRFLAYNRVRQGILREIQVPGRKSAADLDADVLRWIDRRPAGHPFFAFLNIYDAHAPYLPPPPFDTLFVPRSVRGAVPPGGDWKETPAGIREQQGLYDGAIAYTDFELGRLLDALRARRLLDNTIVVVVADHGEEWAEHPRIFGHGNSLYVASLHVPLVVVAPGRVPAGTRVAAPVSTRDVATTILDLAGIPRSPLAGSSLARFWRNPAGALAEAPLLAEVGKATNVASIYPVSVGDLHAVFAGGYQLIVNGDGREELYDLRADPWGQHDLARSAAYAPTLAGLARELVPRGSARP